MGNQPMVLIARLDDGRSLYAVEREDRGLYVLCQLGSWVNVQQLRASAVASTVDPPNKTGKVLGHMDNDPLPQKAPDATKYGKSKRLAIEAIQSMVKRPSTGNLAESQASALESQPPELSQGDEHASNEPAINEASVPPTASELFDGVRSQYLEALYSKVCYSKPTISAPRRTDKYRHHWLILPKDPFLELVQPSTWTTTPCWT